MSRSAERRIQLGAYVLIVIVAALGFGRMEQIVAEKERYHAHEDQIMRQQAEQICESTAINRIALRAQTNYLVNASIEANRSVADKYSKEEIDAAIAQLERYRKEALALTPPTPDCGHRTYADIEREYLEQAREVAKP